MSQPSNVDTAAAVRLAGWPSPPWSRLGILAVQKVPEMASSSCQAQRAPGSCSLQLQCVLYSCHLCAPAAPALPRCCRRKLAAAHHRQQGRLPCHAMPGFVSPCRVAAEPCLQLHLFWFLAVVCIPLVLTSCLLRATRLLLLTLLAPALPGVP